MKMAKALLIGALLTIQASAFAILFQGHEFVPVGDDELENDLTIDSELKKLIKRVVPFYRPDGGMGSAFLAGPTCQKVITAKHNLYDPDTYKLQDPMFSLGSKDGDNYIINLKDSIPKWGIHDEGDIFDLKAAPSDMSCEPVPVLSRSQIRSKIKELTDCRLIGYPNQVRDVKSGTRSTGRSATRDSEGNQLEDIVRSMSECKVTKITPNGMAINNCSSSPGASGAPIFCKVDDTWKYVATNDGHFCKKKGYEAASSVCYNDNYTSHFNDDSDSPNVRAGRAGTFVEQEF